MVLKIAVIGGGVNGLACAFKIKQKYPTAKIVLISNEFSPNTTGDGSGGLWYPYLCGKTPEHLLTKWGIETYNYLHKLWLEGGYGICLVPILNLYVENKNWSEPQWANKVFGYNVLDEKYISYINKLYSEKYTAGHTFSTFVVPPPTLLASLLKQFKDLQGDVLQAKITSLQDPLLKDFDVIVNCSGLGAKFIVPDNCVVPIRGQIAKVYAPWVNYCLMEEDSSRHYIIPREKDCVIGGTRQLNDFNTNIDEKDTQFILNGCQQLIPPLEHAKILEQWAGLRPGRHEIRLEAEERYGQLFIHNYGHGGSGLTLFWGCASDVVSLLDKYVNRKTTSKL